MALNESWHIRSRGRECAATRRPFVTGEPIITALFPDPESSGYLRRDYSLEAWQARGPDEAPPFSSWRTNYAPSAGDKAAPPEKENPEDILRRLVEEDADHTENTRYILAVMLERRKLLRETDTQRTPTGILRIYENRKTGEVYIVKDPNVPLSQVDALQQEVMEFLESQHRQAEAVEPDPAPESSESSDLEETQNLSEPQDLPVQSDSLDSSDSQAAESADSV